MDIKKKLGSPASKKPKKERPTGFEEWGGYMASKKLKLNMQFNDQKSVQSDGTETSSIFKGVSIYVNGYTKPSAEEIKRLMTIHGGTYHYYYSSRTTYMIASNLPDSKVKNLKGQKVVTSRWVTDSIKAGKMLPYQNYLLYTPEMTHGQQRLRPLKTSLTDNESTSQTNCTLTSDSPHHETVDPNTISKKKDISAMDTSLSGSTNDNFTYLPEADISKNMLNDSTVDNKSTDLFNTISPTKNYSSIKAGDPGFISEFYNHSRLHHISTSGQELKLYVQQLAHDHKDKGFPSREKLHLLKQPNLLGNNISGSADQMTKHQITEDYHDLVEVRDKSRSKHQVIMHLDMDCFFVSVGLRNHPELKGRPVAVTHSKGRRNTPQDGSNFEYEASHYKLKIEQKMGLNNDNTEQDFNDVSERPVKLNEGPKYSSDYGSLSEIACCSYEARQAGVKNGMFLGKALRLCPDLKMIAYDFKGYDEVSKQLYDIVASYTLDIEAVSCDELYIDCTELLLDTKLTPLEFSSALRKDIFQKTGCTASAGIGSNMLLARLCTRVAKPNGQYMLPATEAMEFMKKQKVRDLPGVGYTIAAKLECLGIQLCKDLQHFSLSKLQHEFGPKTGQMLFDRCRGKDDKSVTLEKDRKSVSAEINYGIRFQEEKDIYDFINQLATEVHQRLKKIDKKGRAVTLKLKIRKQGAPTETAKFMGHGVCDSISKSTLLRLATDDPKVIAQECCLMSRMMKILPQDYRGLGIQIGRLESAISDTKGAGMLKDYLSKTCVSAKGNKERKDDTSHQIAHPEQTEAKISSKPPVKKHTIQHFLERSPEIGTSVSSHTITSSSDQLDQSVLNALPENVRQDVLSMYNVKSDNMPLLKSLEESENDSQSLDLSVLNALPEYLRLEVLAAYGGKKQSAPIYSTSNKVNTSSASKKIQSLKGNRTTTSLKSLEEPQKDHQSTLDSFAVTVGNCDAGPSNFTSREKANLCGAVHIDDVRSLIKEWIHSTEEPAEEDIEQFKNYVLEIIDEDLPKTNFILKYFYRLANSASKLWKDTYLLVLSYVQQKMLQNFGHMLKAESDFS